MKRFAMMMLAAAVLSLSLTACVVSDDEYEEAKRERNDLSVKLQDQHLANDMLRQEIESRYSELEELSTDLALASALDVHKILVMDGKLTESSPAPTGTRRGETRRQSAN